MIDDESRSGAVHFFHMFLFDIINLDLIIAAILGVVGRKLPSFFKYSVRHLTVLRFDDDVGTRCSFGVEPPVASIGKMESQFFILEIVLSYINVIAVAGQIVERLALKLYFFLREFTAYISTLSQFFLNLCQVILTKCDI